MRASKEEFPSVLSGIHPRHGGWGFRVATTTVPFLLRECISAIEDVIEFDLHPSGAERVRDEIIRKVSGNSIAKKLTKVPLDLYLQTDGKNLETLLRNLRALARDVTPHTYRMAIIEQLQTAAATEKEKICFLAEELVCTLTNIGFDLSCVNERCEQVFFNSDYVPSNGRLQDFLESFNVNRDSIKEYSALIRAHGDLEHVQSDVLKLFRCEVTDSVPEEFDAGKIKAAAFNSQKYLHIKGAKSFDPYSAAKLVTRNLARLRDLLGMFYHKGSTNFSDAIALSEVGIPNSTKIIKPSGNLMQLIADNTRSTAARKLEGMIKTVRLPAGDDGEKFFRIVDFHGMSLNTAMPENQLINLWTSLETIAPSIKGKSIISSVCAGIKPLVGLQYVRRTFSAVYGDLRRWDRQKTRAALKLIEGDGDLIDKTFLLIASPENEKSCIQLLSEMNDFPLLKRRVFELNSRFKSGEKTLKAVELHLTKVEQQLHRIYRARNAIVHSAKDIRLTDNLIISAHEYFDQVFSLTVELSSKPNRFESYAECFSFCELAYSAYSTKLMELKDAPVAEAASFVWRSDRK